MKCAEMYINSTNLCKEVVIGRVGFRRNHKSYCLRVFVHSSHPGNAKRKRDTDAQTRQTLAVMLMHDLVITPVHNLQLTLRNHATQELPQFFIAEGKPTGNRYL